MLIANGLGLDLSSDGGRTWAKARLDGDRPLQVRKIAPHPAQSGVVFVGTDQGLFRSTDAGRTWQKFGRGLPYSPMHEIAVSPEDPQHIFVAGNEGIFHSTDGGNLYARLGNGAGPEGLPVQLLMLLTSESPQILAASAHNGLFLINAREVALARLR